MSQQAQEIKQMRDQFKARRQERLARQAKKRRVSERELFNELVRGRGYAW